MPERQEQNRILRCTDIAGLLPFYLNRSLEEEEARKVEAHLATCAACRREERDTRIVWDLHDGHLPVGLLLDFALARSMPSERQSVVESHLSVCERCSEEVATVRQEHSGADSQEQGKRLIRELDLPEQAHLVTQKAKYWTPAFCWLFFEKCDELIFDDGHAGLRAAEVGPELVELVSRFSRDSEPRPPLRLRALEMKAPFEFALVSLDLGRYLYRSRELDELKSLAVETQQLFSTLCLDPQANQALIVWRDAVLARTVSTEAFANTWQAVQQRAIETTQRVDPV